MKRNAILLISILIFSSSLLILLNYYTIRILSASRSYINGESQYSKGQKDASAHLINFLYSQSYNEYALFNERINVPIGDRIARVNMISNGDHETIVKGFLQGKNNPADVEGLIWLFQCFKQLDEFKQVVALWTTGDKLNLQLKQFGLDAYVKSSSGKLSITERDKLVARVNGISTQLTVLEEKFSNTLGDICRKVNVYIFLTNIFFTILIVGSSLSLAGGMMKRLANSRRELSEKNNKLNTTNSELDKLIYSVTHDLRAPLASLAGLIELIETETNLQEILVYTMMMKQNLTKQNKFIQDILNSPKKLQDQSNRQLCDFKALVEDVMVQHQFVKNGHAVYFKTDLEITRFYANELNLKIVLNNLVSNAIKYADFTKPEVWVKIRTYHLQKNYIIEVEDNGIGIKTEDQLQIFKKFFMASQNNLSSGIGLYLVDEAVKNMNGTIKVDSTTGKGSNFIINIPAA